MYNTFSYNQQVYNAVGFFRGLIKKLSVIFMSGEQTVQLLERLLSVTVSFVSSGITVVFTASQKTVEFVKGVIEALFEP